MATLCAIGLPYRLFRPDRDFARVVSFVCFCILAISAAVVHAASCNTVVPRTPSPAEQAYLDADYAHAAALFRAAIAANGGDLTLIEGLTRSMLRQENVAEAADMVTSALATYPNAPVLLVAKAEVELRQGAPWSAAETINAAIQADPCLPRTHYLMSRIARLNSLYATAQREILLAHQLDPTDPDIVGEWIETLPLRQRVAELERYMSSAGGDSAGDKHPMQLYLDRLKKQLDAPHQPCRLASQTTSTEIPFVELMYDAQHIRAFGLGVRLNQRNARLEIDTGAPGLVVNRSIAQKAGLKPFSETTVGGIGDKGENRAYVAFADSIQIGNLEFRDCLVEVVDKKNLMDIDGLIGMDVLSRFLITLNYPAHKLALGPLPPRPGELSAPLTLSTSLGDTEDQAAKSPDSATPAAPAPASTTKGPYDRYRAPEMKDYTPVYRVGHSLMLPVSLNQSKLKLFVLDTGAWSTTISPAAAREVTKVRSDSDASVRGLSGTVEKVYSADEVTFAFARIAQKIQGVPSFDTSGISKNLGMEISGFLGARTLELTTIHIDYRDGLVKFDYDAKAGAAARHNF